MFYTHDVHMSKYQFLDQSHQIIDQRPHLVLGQESISKIPLLASINHLTISNVSCPKTKKL